jgi:SMC interacting uncharacterized protein involved in chromosome segregation
MEQNMSVNPTREHIIKAILSNEKLSEDEKSELISDFMEEFKTTYPQLQYHATKDDVKESELKLTKEIREVELKLTKEIEEVRNEIKEVELKLTREIEEVRKEIKEVDIRLTKEIGEVKAEIAKSKAETIKFVAGMMIGQVFVIAGLVAGIFKYFIQG